MGVERRIIPRSALPRGVRRRGFGKSPKSWWTKDFDSEVEVLLWRLDDTDHVPYGDTYMLKLSSIVGGKRGTGTPAAVDADMEARWPAILLLLTATVDEAGKPRKTATMTIVCEEGLFKGGVRDRDANASVWRSAKSLTGLYDALEAALMSGEADWRTADPPSRK